MLFQIGDLVNYMEKQRDVYKRSVQKLLDKLDPERKQKLEESLAKEDVYGVTNLKGGRER